MIKNNEKIILGIDPGIADTGYGVIRINERNGVDCITYGSIKTATGQDLDERLASLHHELDGIFKKYKPALCSVEELFFCKNVKTALVVGHARGVVLLTAKINHVPIIEFTPLQVKQAISAYGKADKTQVQRMVKMIYNLKEIPKPDDAADALAVAFAAVNNMK